MGVMSDASLAAAKADPEVVRVLLGRAVQRYGSQAKLAAACDVKQASIWQAIHSGQTSAELAVKIEAATAGDVPATELRPDLPWPALKQAVGA